MGVEKLLGDFGHSFVLWSTVAVSPPSSVPTLRHAYDPGQGILRVIVVVADYNRQVTLSRFAILSSSRVF